MGNFVSVVVPVRNDATGLGAAVVSALEQIGDFEIEVLICVGPSNDGTAKVASDLAQDPRVTALDNPTGAIPAALNRGLAAATGSVLARVDARTVLPAGYLAEAIRVLRLYGAANVGARQVPVGEPGTERAIAAAMSHRLGSGGARYRHGGDIRIADTAFLGVFDIERLRATDGWDNRFERNEDAELNVRLGEHGGVYVHPELLVEYRPRTSLGGLCRQYFDYGWWRMRTVRKHPGTLSARQLAPPVIVAAIMAGVAVGAIITPFGWLVPLGYATVLAAAAAQAESPGMPGAGVVRMPINPESLSGRERVVCALALATMHVSWGVGFMASGLEQIIKRRKGDSPDSVFESRQR